MKPSFPPQIPPSQSSQPPWPPRSAPCTMRCQVSRNHLKLRMCDHNNRLVLHAKLPLFGTDPHALAHLLEVLATYSGRRLDVVVSAAGNSLDSLEFVFANDARDLKSTAWVYVQFDVPAYGLSPAPFGAAGPQMPFNFDDVEF